MKRVAVARIFQETSSFSPRKTTLDDFRQFGLHFGGKVFDEAGNLRDEITGFLQVAREEGGLELVPVMWAVGWTGGPLTAETYAFLKRALVEGIAGAGRLDGVLLALHGSMVAEGTDDTEGDMLAAVRAAIGDLPLVATFDHHGNMTRRIVDQLDGLLAYLECPHSDTMETGARGARLMMRLLRGEAVLTLAFRKIPMITPADRFETGKPPLKEWFDAARELERLPGVLAISQFPVQPWLDVEEYGWSVVVMTDNDAALAERLAARLAQQAWDMRERFLVNNPGPAEAIRRALREPGPIVIADGADATNGGAPGDSTVLLKEMLKQRVEAPAFLTVVDPEAVARALEAGIGNAVTVDLGGKRDPANSTPVRITAVVTRASDGKFRIVGGSHHATPVDMGRTVVLRAGAIHIVVSEKLNPGHDPLVYRHIGLEPADAQMVVVKCVVGHMKAYASIMKKTIWTDTPGPTPSNLLRLAHRRAPRPLFPLDRDMEWRAALSAGSGG